MSTTNPRPGDLKRRIRILTIENRKTPDGYVEEIITDSRECWAAVTDDTTQHLNSVDPAVTNLCFIIRYDARVRPRMWIEYGENRHRIQEIKNMNHDRRYMQIFTKRKEAIH